MIPAFKPKFAPPKAASFSADQVSPEQSCQKSTKVGRTSMPKTPVSLTDSQYEEIFASVSKRVLETDFLDLDERFAGSQEALENSNDLGKSEVEQKKVKNKRKRETEKVNDNVENTSVTPSETFAKSISSICSDSNKRDNEITPSVSPHEQNTVVIKKPKLQKQKRQPPFKAKRKSLEYSEHSDTWVQCSRCEKWRHLLDCKDPTLLPDVWTCSMNTFVELAKCSIPEDTWDELDSQTEYVYTDFIPGSLVWAKMDGYPTWPAMVDFDPDNGIYYEAFSTGEVSHYHVVFLDEKVSRAWITNKKIEAYHEDETPIKLPRDSSRRSEFSKDLHAAKLRAREAASMSVEKRMGLFSFGNRFHGKSHWSRDRNSIEKKQKRKAKQKISSNSKSDEIDKAPVDTKATVKPSLPVYSNEDDSEKVENQPSFQDNSIKSSSSPKHPELQKTDINTQNITEEPYESKDTSVISMSDVSLEKQYEDVLQQGMKIEDCDSSLNIPFIVIDPKHKSKPIEFDPDVFTMEMKSDGFADACHDEKGPLKHLEMNNTRENVFHGRCSNGADSPATNAWLSPSKETGISADNMFDSVTANELENVDQSGSWDEIENLVMDIPDCFQ